MKKVIIFVCLTLLAWADPVVDHPSGNRTTPPTIESVSPRAVARGISQELKIEGFNLAGTRAIYFSEPGVEARISGVKELPAVPEEVRLGAGGLPSTIDLGPLPSRYEVAVELDIPPDAPLASSAFVSIHLSGPARSAKCSSNPTTVNGPMRNRTTARRPPPKHSCPRFWPAPSPFPATKIGSRLRSARVSNWSLKKAHG